MVDFDQMWFIFHHTLPSGPHTTSISVATFGFPWYRSSHPDPRKKVLNCKYDLLIGQILLPSQVFFSCWGTENTEMVPNQNMEGDQPGQSHSQAQQPLQPQTCVQEHCPGEIGLPSSVFQAVLKCL